MNIGETLHKWYKAKKKLELIEKKIDKYKAEITKEMNKTDRDELNGGGYSVSRRRNTRTYVTKENLPVQLWKEYCTQCSYDSFYLVRK
jgi:effector-binding domain-containing protein